MINSVVLKKSPEASSGDFFLPHTWNARLDLAYANQEGLTVPTLRKHIGPLRIQKGFRAEAPSAPHVWHQYILHPPGGIAGQDRLHIDVNLQTNSHVMLTSPGAAKWYRGEHEARQQISLTVCNSILEWLPLENIYFNGAQANNTLKIICDKHSTVFAADVSCFGRPASHETFSSGKLRLSTRFDVDGEPVFIENAVIHGDDEQLSSTSGMRRFPIMGQLLAYDMHCDSADLEAVRTSLEQDPQLATRCDALDWGITRIAFPRENGWFIMIRCRSREVELAWHALRLAWKVLRPRWLKMNAHTPRIWST